MHTGLGSLECSFYITPGFDTFLTSSPKYLDGLKGTPSRDLLLLVFALYVVNLSHLLIFAIFVDPVGCGFFLIRTNKTDKNILIILTQKTKKMFANKILRSQII